jgi:hypothetical protein
LLEQKKVKGIIKFGDDRNNQMIMSHKQGKKIIQGDETQGLKII